MNSAPRLRKFSALSGLVIAACGARTVPSEWPAESPASPAASEARVAVVTLALTEHPPLPGEPATGWGGLAGSAAVSSHGAHAPAGHDGHEFAESYSCPMHPDVVSDRPGQCPRCGMTLVKKDAPK